MTTSLDTEYRKNSMNEIQDHPDNENDVETNEEKLKYPRSVFFIISNEFCERFSYYGMRTILTLYLTNMLLYSDKTATVVYHTFTMFVYFFPLLGAIIADSWLGKFRTIFYLSIIYAFGQLLLSLSATPSVGLPQAEFSLLGLFLIAIGTGGIKPCVAAFGGDQFILPQQQRYLESFFSLFYFSINSGSLISTFLTPILRSNVSCDGATTCYFLAFLVPAILMVISIVIFVLGKRMYRIMQPMGNVVVTVAKCVSHALSNKIKKKETKRDHWLDYADDVYESKLIQDIKASMQVLKLFIPLPVFWALYDQQGSRWTLQAARMDGEIGNYLMEPDQLQVINPLLILAFIPLFESCIYPLFAKIHLINTPLKKLTVGALLASVAFVVSGIVELQLEKTYPELPTNGFAQIRIFNTLNCPVDVTIQGKQNKIDGLSMWVDKEVPVNKSIILPYTADFSACNLYGYSKIQNIVEGSITANETEATSWAIIPQGFSNSYIDTIEKPRNGTPRVRSLFYLDPGAGDVSILKFVYGDETSLSINITSDFSNSDLLELKKAGKYDIYLNEEPLQKDVSFKQGGVYTIVGSHSAKEKVAKIITVTEPNSMHMMWLLPQLIIITMGEVMFSVTGLQFAFTQAPESMKSLLQAAWLLTVAIGNLIVVIVAEVSIFDSQAYEFFLFAGLMVVDIAIFAVMSIFYKYVELPEESTDDDISMERMNGNINSSFTNDKEGEK